MIIAGIFLLLAFVVWYGYDQQTKRYEQIIRIMEADRDKTRQELLVYRNLLFPVLGKAGNTEGTAEVSRADFKPTARTAQVSAAPSGLPNRRIPFRIRFKQRIKELNTPQKARDALVSALEKQPSGDKSHA